MLRSLWGFILALSILVGHPLMAQPAAEASAAPNVAVALAHRVEKLKAAFTSGQASAIQAASLEVELLRRDYGTLDVTPLVEAMALWARQEGHQGRPEVGLKAVVHVERWAPKHPILLSSRVVLQRQQGITGYIESLPEVMELTKLRISHPTHRWLFVAQHLAWLRLMTTLMLWAWALTLVLRYRRAFRYIVEQPLTRMLPNGGVRAFVCAAMLCAPVLLGLDPGLVALFWLWLSIPFLFAAELKLSLLVILLQLVHPILSFLEPMTVQQPRPSLVAMQLQPSWKPVAWESIKTLPQSDREYLVGWRLLQEQQWSAAEQQFRHLQKSHDFRVGVLNNLAVALYQQGRTAEAQPLFEEAFRAAPGTVEVLTNQSIQAFRALDSVVGGQKQDEARKANPERYAQLTSASQSRTEQRTFAVPLPDSEVREQALVAHFGSLEATGKNRGYHQAALVFWTILPLTTAGLFVWRARQSIREAHPTQCIRCGDPFHTTDSPDVEVCSKCHHLFVLKDGLHSESRKLKVDEVGLFQTYQRWIHRLLIVVLPGADLAFLGHTEHGFVELTLYTLALGVVLGTGRTVRYSGELLSDPVTIWLPVGLGLLGILLFRSWLKLIPRR